MSAPPARKPGPRGPRASLTAEQQALAAAHVPFARKLSRRRKAWFPSFRDDWDSAALLALVEAAQSYDPNRGVKFATFAAYRISGALANEARRLGLRDPRGADDEPSDRHSPCLDDEQVDGDLTAAQGPTVEEITESDDEVEWWVRRLPPRHASVFRLILDDGMSRRQIARELGMTLSMVSRLYAQGLDLLRDAAPRPDDATRLPR